MALVDETATIVSNNPVGTNLWLMVLHAPRTARAIQPGQFVHLLIPGMDHHPLRRPFSVYAATADLGQLEILYQVVGFGTQHMTSLKPAQMCQMIGPVGNGWNPPASTRRALLVGGGVGAAPLYMLAQQLVGAGVALDVVLGAQTVDTLATRERFEALLAGCSHATVACATDDGSFGHAGFCTPLVEAALQKAADEGKPYDYVAVCGPEPLMKLVARMAHDADAYCEVSTEKRMACGVGACLSCVVDTTAGKKRACVDGPVFAAEEVVWS